MRYRISQIKVNPKDRAEKNLNRILETAVVKEIRRKLRSRKQPTGDVQVRNLEIIRESIDARKKPDVKLVYTVDFDCDEKLPFDAGGREDYQMPAPSNASDSVQRHRPVIIGFGPCGIFAALILAEAGLKPIVIERGKSVPERIADVEKFWKEAEDAGNPDPESNVQFGEGGAGTFSDGKLTTGIKDIRIRKVLEEFVEAGADPQILYQHRPHIGTDKLREIIPKFREKIENAGGEVRFSKKLESLDLVGGRLRGIYVSSRSGERERIEADEVILAIGHSARDTFRKLYEQGLRMEQKPFSIGVRIEHPQEMIDESQYGDPSLAEVLGPADYKLSYRCEAGDSAAFGRGVYTFCMCPGGQVINASTEPGTSVTNGMSVSGRDSGWANSGLLVDVRTEDFKSEHPLAGIEFQRTYEKKAWEHRNKGGMAVSDYESFHDPTDPVRTSLPAFASEAILEAMPIFGHKVKGFDRPDARFTAVETRSSSPVRILRSEDMQALGLEGLIPAGEGPGYAGGIMSAAVDGIKAAEKIIMGL